MTNKPKKCKYHINGEGFKTQEAIKDIVKEIFDRYDYGDILNDDDQNFMLDLFKYHHDWENKKSIGIKSIIKKKNPLNKTYAIYLLKIDNSEIDISYREALRGLSKRDIDYPMEFFIESCREAVFLSIKEFKKNMEVNGKLRCEGCGKVGYSTEIDAHHMPPNTFQKIVEDYIRDKNIKCSEIEFEDAIKGKKFKNLKDRDEFIKYHSQKMNLRLLCKKKCHRHSS